MAAKEEEGGGWHNDTKESGTKTNILCCFSCSGCCRRRRRIGVGAVGQAPMLAQEQLMAGVSIWLDRIAELLFCSVDLEPN